ncbi:MAG: acyl carrier protein [Candidatus Omnitrophica bacterium]|nr:acyl carrier protein [Candidatus Omnitrophota bacterium]
MQQEIASKVQEVLSAALGVDRQEVRPDAALSRDLGAESIDYIDIIFRLEKAFDIKIPSGDLFPGNILNDDRFVQSGVVTPAGLAELKAKVPYLNIDAFARDPQVSKLSDFFTVQMIIQYVQDRLAKEVKA